MPDAYLIEGKGYPKQLSLFQPRNIPSSHPVKVFPLIKEDPILTEDAETFRLMIKEQLFPELHQREVVVPVLIDGVIIGDVATPLTNDLRACVMNALTLALEMKNEHQRND